MIDCPALHIRRHDKGYPFGERVPKRIRMVRYAEPPTLLAFISKQSGETVSVARVGDEFDAWTNSYGAVAAVFPDGGGMLGVRPDEFEVIEWLEVHPNQSKLRKNPATS